MREKYSGTLVQGTVKRFNRCRHVIDQLNAVLTLGNSGRQTGCAGKVSGVGFVF